MEHKILIICNEQRLDKCLAILIVIVLVLISAAFGFVVFSDVHFEQCGTEYD